jgi:hypothetical protein
VIEQVTPMSEIDHAVLVPEDDDLGPTGPDMSPDDAAFDPPVVDEVLDLPPFDPATATDVVGEPAVDAEAWHLQEADDTCAIAAQEFVLENLTGVDLAEGDLVAVAQANGWYQPGGGTAMGDVGKVLEAFGVGVTRTEDATLGDLEAALARGDGVIVGVDSEEIWNPGLSDDDDTEVGDAGGIPGQDADHAVQVIGIDRSDPGNPQVVLNDPGHPDGQAVLVPEQEFLGAWEDAGRFAVFATTTGVAA